MASHKEGDDEANQVVPEEDDNASVKSIQSRYLRSPSPSRFSVISDTDTESIFMEPIHLSSKMAARQIISEEMKPKEIKVEPVAESMLESAEQLMVEDLYNRVKDMMDDTSPYNTPCVLDIQRAIVQDRLEAPFNPVDEVWPNIFIAEKTVAVNKCRLKRLGITHVLNAAHGTGVYTGPDFYTGMNIQYLGIEVDDFSDADISQHLRTAAEFLDEALLTHRGKVLVNSVMGVSRSAVLVAAYLMIFHHMTIMEALLALRKKRPINPNEGFLKQLRELNEVLLEERDDDDSDTLSQSSVIEACPRQNRVPESILGAKAHSILVDEEEDGSGSVMSSMFSAERLGSADQNQDGYLPGEEREGEEAEGEEDDLERAIREWQKRNEKYQSEEWWQAQLACEGAESLPGGSRPSEEDLESVTSTDIRALKEQLDTSGRRRLRKSTGSVSTVESSSSCADMWKQRLKEIEERSTYRYRSGTESESIESEEDTESLLSETGSLYNFCQKNKDKLTPLERWRVKRIQFGWNKKDAETEKGSTDEANEAGNEDKKAPPLGEVNLTAYQSWKLKQQKKLGVENKEEVVELGRTEDSAAAKRRQRREEILERSRQTLEESQSVCGWESESAITGGSSIPLSAFWPQSVASDDATSVLSSRSGRSSAMSHARSIQGTPMLPLVPIQNLQGPGNESVNLASIQNWIANVVTETLIQKQGEVMMMMGGSLPPSRAGSVLGVGRNLEDDKASMLSGASYSSSLLSGGGTFAVSGSLGTRKGKITTTSVPLYSLFQDQVNLRQLDSMDKEMKSEMRDKMAAYEVKKITEDNRRSTLYKKKKPKEDSDDEESKDDGLGIAMTANQHTGHSYAKSNRASSDLKVRLGRAELEGDNTRSIDRWLREVSAPPRSATSYSGESSKQQTFTETHGCVTFKQKRDYCESSAATEEEDYGGASRFSPRASSDLFSPNRYRAKNADFHRHPSPEQSYSYRGSPTETEYSTNSLIESHRSRTHRSYDTEEEEEVEEEEEEGQAYAAKRKFTNYSGYEEKDSVVRKGSRDIEKEEEGVSSIISRAKLRSRPRMDEDLDEDDIIAAWRIQQESKACNYSADNS